MIRTVVYEKLIPADRWTYRLTAKSILTYPLVATVGAFGFWGAMRACLGTIAEYFAE